MSRADAAGARAVQGHAAGFATRAAAAVVDLVIVMLAVGFAYLAVAGILFAVRPQRFHWPEWLSLTIPGAYLVLAVSYLLVAWRTTGQTLGDALFGVRVRARCGGRLGRWQALFRSILCVVVPVGLLWIPFSRGRLSLQDVLVRSEVRYDWSPHVPSGVETAAVGRVVA